MDSKKKENYFKPVLVDFTEKPELVFGTCSSGGSPGVCGAGSAVSTCSSGSAAT